MLLKTVWNVLSSLRLTVVCLVLAVVLVYKGTMAQVDIGLYLAQAKFFKSFLIWWGPQGASWHIPVFPGGYLIGGVLLVNLIAGHIRRFGLSKKKLGLVVIHAGLILLLIGQLLTDLLSRESSMRLTEGETRNYSEDHQNSELVLVDKTNPEHDQVFQVPEKALARQKELAFEPIQMTVRVKQFWSNSELLDKAEPGAIPTGATQGAAAALFLAPKELTTKMNERNLPSALVEVLTPKGSLGTWFVDDRIRPQTFTAGDRTFDIALRTQRYYKPFNLSLVKFSHDKYQGTEIAKNFSSRVRLQNPATKEDREVLIYMNNPLRYQGETFYQSGFDENDNRVTILQVVHNPSWLAPYFSCILVGLGLAMQFLSHFVGFIKRKVA